MAKKILIADDDRGITKMLTQRLQAHGYEVLIAHDGEAALDMAKKEHPDLIIMDVLMPRINGAAVCGMLKFDKDLRSIPVMMLTVKNRAIDQEVGKTLKADAFMTKPFDGKELIDMIKNLLGEGDSNEAHKEESSP